MRGLRFPFVRFLHEATRTGLYWMKRRIPVTPADAKVKLRARLSDFNDRRFTIRRVFDAGPEDLFFVHSQHEADTICRWLSACQELVDYQILDQYPNGENEWNKPARQQPESKRESGQLSEPTRSRKILTRNRRKDWERATEPPKLWDL